MKSGKYDQRLFGRKTEIFDFSPTPMATPKKSDETTATKGRKPKKEVFVEHGTHEKDTGSVPVQVALLTSKISHLTEHLKLHPKDDHGRRGLLSCVAKRRKLLSYTKEKSKAIYEELIEKLGLRR